MIFDEIMELYKKFRLLSYRSMFGKIREKNGSLSATEAFAADVIYLLGSPTLGQFADCLGISQPNATYKVNNLISKGYVSKTISELDRRECRLGVTDKFYSYYDPGVNSIDAALEKVRANCTDSEISAFVKVLRTLNGAI